MGIYGAVRTQAPLGGVHGDDDPSVKLDVVPVEVLRATVDDGAGGAVDEVFRGLLKAWRVGERVGRQQQERVLLVIEKTIAGGVGTVPSRRMVSMHVSVKFQGVNIIPFLEPGLRIRGLHL